MERARTVSGMTWTTRSRPGLPSINWDLAMVTGRAVRMQCLVPGKALPGAVLPEHAALHQQVHVGRDGEEQWELRSVDTVFVGSAYGPSIHLPDGTDAALGRTIAATRSSSSPGPRSMTSRPDPMHLGAYDQGRGSDALSILATPASWPGGEGQ